MDIATIRAFLLWCTILNSSLLALSFLMSCFAGDWIHKMHSMFFPLPRETFNTVIYSYLGLYKVLVLVFNLVPYLALVIIG